MKECSVINLSQNGWLVSSKGNFVLDAQFWPDFDCISSVIDGNFICIFFLFYFLTGNKGRFRFRCLGLQAPGMSSSWIFVTAQLLTLAVVIWLLNPDLLHQLLCHPQVLVPHPAPAGPCQLDLCMVFISVIIALPLLHSLCQHWGSQSQMLAFANWSFSLIWCSFHCGCSFRHTNI